MADVQVAPLALQWGRASDGRFFIAVAVSTALPDGKVGHVPTSRFILSQEEEQSLLEKLTGLAVVNSPLTGLRLGQGKN